MSFFSREVDVRSASRLSSHTVWFISNFPTINNEKEKCYILKSMVKFNLIKLLGEQRINLGMKYKLISFAIKLGNIEMLKHLFDSNFGTHGSNEYISPGIDLFKTAIVNRQVKVLEWLNITFQNKNKGQHNIIWDLTLYNYVNDINCLKYLYENRCPFKYWVPSLRLKSTISIPIRQQDLQLLECIKYLIEKELQIVLEICTRIAELGYIECLKFLHMNGFKLNEGICNKALEVTSYDSKGNIIEEETKVECLKYLIENGCIIDKNTCNIAIENTNIKCLEYLLSIDAYWNKKTCINAAKLSNTGCIDTLFKLNESCHKLNPFFSIEMYRSAAILKNLNMLKYLYDHECPYDESVFSRFFFQTDNEDNDDRIACFEFLIEKKFPFSDSILQEITIRKYNPISFKFLKRLCLTDPKQKLLFFDEDQYIFNSSKYFKLGCDLGYSIPEDYSFRLGFRYFKLLKYAFEYSKLNKNNPDFAYGVAKSCCLSGKIDNIIWIIEHGFYIGKFICDYACGYNPRNLTSDRNNKIIGKSKTLSPTCIRYLVESGYRYKLERIKKATKNYKSEALVKCIRNLKPYIKPDSKK